MDSDKILHKLNISALNSMQEKVIDAMLHTDKDIVVLSPTGSGKTLAYLLPLVSMVERSSDGLQAVVIVPGRELAIQSDTVCRNMGSGVRSLCLYGGRSAMEEHHIIEKNHPHIVFSTPGRLIDHLVKGNLNAEMVKFLVIDEFDKCLKMGFRREMSQALGLLKAVERRILLSATDTDFIPTFVQMGRTLCINKLNEAEQVPDRVGLYYVKSPRKDKLETLYRLICDLGDSKTVVFLNFRDSVERVSDYLRMRGVFVSEFHGGMEQNKREEAIYKFSNGSTNVLVATDLASRGLDMPEVDNVIHYHLPIGEDEYVHRVGRTARWQECGCSFFLFGPDESLPSFVKIRPLKYEISDDMSVPSKPRMVTLYIGKGKKDKISKGDVVGFLCKNSGISGSDIGRIDVFERYSYVAVSFAKWHEVVDFATGKKLKGVRTIVEKAF